MEIRMLKELKKEMQEIASPKRAEVSMWFFKTGKGQYGEGDKFMGISNPDMRKLVKKYNELEFNEIEELLLSKYHEHRLIALLILVYKYQKSKDEKEKKKIADFYLANTKSINNWDLVDLSAYKILGDYLLNKDGKEKGILYKLAKSSDLWERRIAIISTFEFIRNKQFEDTIKISEMLLSDKHDLMHKAVGWMLREMGKRDEKELIRFLDKYSTKMPRTMLRYAIEKLDSKKKEYYMKRK